MGGQVRIIDKVVNEGVCKTRDVGYVALYKGLMLAGSEGKQLQGGANIVPGGGVSLVLDKANTASTGGYQKSPKCVID